MAKRVRSSEMRLSSTPGQPQPKSAHFCTLAEACLYCEPDDQLILAWSRRGLEEDGIAVVLRSVEFSSEALSVASEIGDAIPIVPCSPPKLRRIRGRRGYARVSTDGAMYSRRKRLVTCRRGVPYVQPMLVEAFAGYRPESSQCREGN
jgi:hypothetical protein